MNQEIYCIDSFLFRITLNKLPQKANLFLLIIAQFLFSVYNVFRSIMIAIPTSIQKKAR
jgi:ABC-type uncharacterized transport system YnjBCD ATPase subunit